MLGGFFAPYFSGGPHFACSRRIQPWVRARRILATNFQCRRAESRRAESREQKHKKVRFSGLRSARCEVVEPTACHLGQGFPLSRPLEGRDGSVTLPYVCRVPGTCAVYKVPNYRARSHPSTNPTETVTTSMNQRLGSDYGSVSLDSLDSQESKQPQSPNATLFLP
jgi:hypothetical protein